MRSGSTKTSCGSALNKVFGKVNVLILIWGIVMIFLFALAFYANGQKNLREKYAVGQETSVASAEETIENTQAYEAASTVNLSQCILYFAASLAVFIGVWFVMCLIF